MDAAAVRAMVDEDRQEWQTLCVVLDAHPDGPLHDPESPEWTARDVYTHLAAMMEGSTALMEEYLAGKPHRKVYEGTDEDDTNARIRHKHADMTFDQARAWAQRAFENMIAQIQAIPTDRWDTRFEFYARADGADHYRGHRGYIAGG
jgi:hypothetical protein